MTDRIFGMEKPDLNDVQHHGVKGMKWGVRKQQVRDSYAQATRNKAKSFDKVAKGTASKRDKAKVFATTSSANVQKHGGLKNAAKVKADSLESRARRIESGKATTKDILIAYGTVSSHQLGTAAKQVKARQN